MDENNKKWFLVRLPERPIIPWVKSDSEELTDYVVALLFFIGVMILSDVVAQKFVEQWPGAVELIRSLIR